MAILEHDAFMSDELRRVPLKELTNRLDSFRRVMTERDPAWKMAVITDKIDMYYFAGTMQDGAFIIRPEDAILWVRRSLARAKNESLLPEIHASPHAQFSPASRVLRKRYTVCHLFG